MELRTAFRAAFPPTRWSIVLRARDPRDEPAARVALAELCRVYWYPLYAYARRQGSAPPDAEDLTQSFFARVLESNLLANTGPEAGRLRTFLLVAFERDMADARRAAQRLKRGGGAAILSIDRDLAEERFRREPALQIKPAAEFDRHWAITVLATSMDRLAEEYAAAGKREQFQAFRPFLSEQDGTGSGDSYEGACARLGVSKPAARQAVHRLRERFRVLLRSQIADTLREPTEETVDAELASLKVALGGSPA